MSDGPWATIAAPSAADAITARRVDADLKWDFFWGRAVDRKYLFALQHDDDAAPPGRLPNLRGIDITSVKPPSEQRRLLIFKLQDTAQAELFEKLCLDIVRATRASTTQKEAVAITLARTWRWHHLLRGGSISKLNPEEQKGLIAELLVLERKVLPCFGPDASLGMWHGPLDAPKDFECVKICIEAKARRGAATPYIYISSASQLDRTGTDALFVFVLDLDLVPPGTTASFTVTDVARRIQTAITSSQSALAVFDKLLEAAGFQWEDDYSDFWWLEGQSRYYQVRDGFPAIAANDLSAGVSQVTYAVALPACALFAVAVDAITKALEATKDA